jgi:hypothetical protein
MSTPAEKMLHTICFAIEKETKGAVRYQEVEADGKPAFAPKVGTLYLRKTALPGRPLSRLLVTIMEDQTS